MLTLRGAGFEIVEMNASDNRNAEDVDKVRQYLCSSTSKASKLVKRSKLRTSLR